jgi:hypothetical protein
MKEMLVEDFFNLLTKTNEQEKKNIVLKGTRMLFFVVTSLDDGEM